MEEGEGVGSPDDCLEGIGGAEPSLHACLAISKAFFERRSASASAAELEDLWNMLAIASRTSEENHTICHIATLH